VLFARIDPGDDEHGPPLFDQPAHHALLGHKVDHVEAVDQRRHVQQRLGGDVGRGGRVLDELEQVGLMHDLTGRGGDGLALPERVRIAAAAHDALPARHILQQIGEPLGQIGAAGRQRTLDHVGVGVGEVGGRDGVQILVEQEVDHRPPLRVALPLRDNALQLVGGEQVGVADGAVIGVILPRRCRKAPVARLLTRGAADRTGPESAPLLHRLHLHGKQVERLGGDAAGEVAHRVQDRERIVRARLASAPAGHGVGHRLGGLGPGVGHWRVNSRPTIMRMT
jgi:hypothetical protein